MQIGEVIRKYRKMKNMTQEEMAKRLGVTAPAVNKWENGNTNPDITLLAPIARLLDITLDTLLSFHEQLTDEEMKNIIYEADAKFKEEPYEEVFAWAKEKMEQYPNCEWLILQLAQVLYARCLTEDGVDSCKYEDDIRQCYVRVLESGNEDIRIRAADALFGFYVRKKQYEQAEKYLAYFSKQNPQRNIKQAIIYSKTNRINEAYKAYEELLFSQYQMTSMLFSYLYMLAEQDNDMDKLHMLVEKQRALARVFDMGQYYEVSCGLELAVLEKDAAAAIEIMEKMLSGIDTISDCRKSPLYEHITFQGPRAEFLAEFENKLRSSFQDEETFGFLKNDVR